MSSIYRITIVVVLFLGASVVAFLGWRDYQLRQNEFYKLGALYKAKFPRAGKYVADELKKGDQESLMTMAVLLIPENASVEEKEFIRSVGDDYLFSDMNELPEKANAFVKGFESTPSTSR